MTQLKWSKAPCRFCGTGCGVEVAVKDNRVVATQGDPKAEVNRGLNCVKGYFLSKIMYGKDRLTQPLLRMKNGKYDKNGDFTPDQLGPMRSTSMAVKFKRRHQGRRARPLSACSARASGRSWKATLPSKLMKAGFRSNNLDPNARHCMASAVAGFMRTFGIGRADGLLRRLRSRRRVRAVGLEHGGDAPDPVVARDRPTPVGAQDEGRACFRRSSIARSIWPIFRSSSRRRPTSRCSTTSRTTSSPTRRSTQDFVNKHTVFKPRVTDIGYGLRPDNPLQKGPPQNADKVGRLQADLASTSSPSSSRRTTLDYTTKLANPDKMQGDGTEAAAREACRAVCRSEDQGRLVLDHGLQPAHPRHLGEQHDLQPAPADREDRRRRATARSR
ncbi:hypothetical protein ACU4HD_46070 [Cupriavidus basilensis]